MIALCKAPISTKRNPESVRRWPRIRTIWRDVEGGTEISAIDPVASMQAIESNALHGVAGEVRDIMRAVVNAA